MDNEYNFGKYIRLIRVKREIAVKDLAAKIEISSSYLSKIETGKKKAPHDEKFLVKLSESLDVDYKQLALKARINNIIESDNMEMLGRRKNNVIRLLKISSIVDDGIFIKACIAFVREIQNNNVNNKNSH